MRQQQPLIENFVKNSGFKPFSNNRFVCVYIKGIKIEWNWASGSIVVGAENNSADLNNLYNILNGQRFVRKIEQLRNFIHINRDKTTPPSVDDYEDTVKLITRSIINIKQNAIPPRGQSPQFSLTTTDTDKDNNQETPCYNLTQEEIDILVSLCGTGDFPNADVLFFANEEGFGGNSINHVIEERKRLYKEHNLPLDGQDNTNGHYYEDHTGVAYPLGGAFLNYCSRLMLKLRNHPNGSWHLPMGLNINEAKVIRSYHRYELFREEKPYISGLFELRPLPRANEGTYPYCPGIIDQVQYNKAFSCNPVGIDKYHMDLRNERIRILKNIFKYTSAKTIIGVGAKDYKKCFIQQMFPSISFREIKLVNVSIHYGVINIDGRDIRIYLCPFFGQGFKGLLGLDDLQSLGNLILANGV